MVKVFIDGREGTTGLRIHERLSAREDITLLTISDALRKDMAERKRLLNEADVAFLCLPDQAAIEAVSLVENPNTIVIDASTAHRTLPDWAYGFADLSDTHRQKIQQGKRIAVPGCHASGFIALVYPLIAGGVLPKDAWLSCHSVTGYTGGGKKMIAEYEDISRIPELDSPRQYALGQQHKHLAEMVAITGLQMPPIFSPIVADFPCGMVVTIGVHASQMIAPIGVKEIQSRFEAHYRDRALVQVTSPDGQPAFLAANPLSGHDSMHISVHGCDERILLTAQFDNLGKGASGAAVQCMNIALGLPETTSLCI